MSRLIHVPINSFSLEGELAIPKDPLGLVLFVHGSGSSRRSPRNTAVARVLNQAKLSTFLIDLLSEEEDQEYQTRFNIELLTERVSQIIDWLQGNPETSRLPLGLFGASTGAAAALIAAAKQPNSVKAVVSRGGRPDLAKGFLEKVKAPVLMIVGGEDPVVIELNKEASASLSCMKKTAIIPHATHLFEEAGCLEKVAALAKDWFLTYLK